MVIVFVTLLQPESERPLSGIQAPGEPDRTQVPGPVNTGPTDQPGNEPGGGPPTGGGVGPPAAPGGPAPAAPDAGPAAPEEVPETPGDDAGGDDMPSDDQYADTLSRLVGRLN
jgi:hypothetical protein